jgi:CheY-like chemotaxis protein
MNRDMQRALANGSNVVELQQAAVQSGMRPMLEIGLERVRNGDTTLEEIERVLGAEEETSTTSTSVERRVLITDDDAQNRFVARVLLEKNGFEVVEADNGEAALQAVANEKPFNLILLDLEMPRLDGQSTLRQLKSQLTSAGVPVIVLTGSETEKDEVAAMENGAEDFIRKPMQPDRFMARVNAVMRRCAA